MRTAKQKKVRGQMLLYCHENKIPITTRGMTAGTVKLPISSNTFYSILNKRHVKRDGVWELLYLMFFGEPIPQHLGVEVFKLVLKGEGITFKELKNDAKGKEYWQVNNDDIKRIISTMIFPKPGTSERLAKLITKRYAYAAKLQTASSC